MEIIYGIHPVLEAIKSGETLHKVLIQKGSNLAEQSELIKLLRQFNVPFQFAPKEKLNRVTRKNHQGVIAQVAAVQYHDYEKLIQSLYEEGKSPFILYLDQITDVRNMGAVARSAEAFGVHAIIVPATGSVHINEDAVKTSSGALNRIKVCRIKFPDEAIKYSKNSGLKIIACTENGDIPLKDAELSTPAVFIVGSEEKGISKSLLNLSDMQVKIPLTGKTASLNVSVATAILLYEVVR